VITDKGILQTILLFPGIRNGALPDNPTFDVPTNNCKKTAFSSYNSQSGIGWSHSLRGRFSRHGV
jgi:hypothetical protein